MTKPDGDSSEQREAEIWLLDSLSQKLGVSLTKKKHFLSNGSWIELDGFCQSPLILCEIWAHIGSPKSAQKNKVMTDTLKLLLVNEALFDGQGKCVLLFADQKASEHFNNKSWMAQCLNHYHISIEVMPLPAELEIRVLSAQKRQFR